MEGILPLIIALIIGALFKGKKNQPKEQEQQQVKPFTAQQEHRDDPLRRLKEKSREMYREIQQEMQQESERQSPPVQSSQKRVMPTPVVVTSEIAEVSKPTRRERRETSQERQTMNRTTSNRVRSNQSKTSTERFLPTKEEDLIKGVIFSEIFGPPKSRR